MILERSKALRNAVDHTFDWAVRVQRCQVRNLETFWSTRRIANGRGSTRSCVAPYSCNDAAKARQLLEDLAGRLQDEFPNAAASVREGLDETLRVLATLVSDRLRRSLVTTNPIESP